MIAIWKNNPDLPEKKEQYVKMKYQNTALARIDRAVIDRIIEMRTLGKSVREIHETLGLEISQSSVVRICAGVSFEDKMAKAKEQVIGLVKSGSTRTDAAAAAGVSRVTANAWCKGLPGGGRGGGKRSANE